MLKLLVVLSFLIPGLSSFAEEPTVKESVQEAGRDAKKEVKKGARAVQDKTCEMVNGKMQCLGKKAKHKMENAVDEVKDKTDLDKK